MYLRQSLIAAATTMALVACGGGDSTAPADTPTATTPATSTPSPLAPDFPNLNACITNNWIMGAEQVVKGLEAVGGGVNFTGTGSQTSVFSAGGRYSGTSAFTVNFTRGGTSGTSQYTGPASGTWSVDGDRLTITRTSSSVIVTTTIGGVSTSVGSGVGSPSTVKVISCTPATLTYDQTLSSGTVVRIVLVAG
ncbi:MAG: hypothetical protein ABL923_13255 [Burkholderiaceae bacterium]